MITGNDCRWSRHRLPRSLRGGGGKPTMKAGGGASQRRGGGADG
jgi:hypothetical protein